MVMCDIMHIPLLGICQLLCASVIWELLQERHWPEVLRGTWQNRMDSQLAVAYTEFRQLLKASGLQSSQPRFNVLMLGMHTQSDVPVLKAKAANTLQIMR